MRLDLSDPTVARQFAEQIMDAKQGIEPRPFGAYDDQGPQLLSGMALIPHLRPGHIIRVTDTDSRDTELTITRAVTGAHFRARAAGGSEREIGVNSAWGRSAQLLNAYVIKYQSPRHSSQLYWIRKAGSPYEAMKVKAAEFSPRDPGACHADARLYCMNISTRPYFVKGRGWLVDDFRWEAS